METGTFAANWPGVNELEVIVAPDSTRSPDRGRRTPRKAYARLTAGGGASWSSTGVPHNGRPPCTPPCPVCTFRVSSGVFWQVHVGAADALARAVRAALGAGPGRRRGRPLCRCRVVLGALADDVGRSGSVLAVERDRRACADADYNGQGRPQLKVDSASITPNLIEHGIGRPDLWCSTRHEKVRAKRSWPPWTGPRKPAACGLRLVRPVLVQPGPTGAPRCALDPRLIAGVRHLPHDRARRAGGQPSNRQRR